MDAVKTHTSNQKRVSTKIFFGFTLIVAAIYFGLMAYSQYRVSHIEFKTVKPGRVNIVGFALEKGFRIIVANSIAQLVEVSDKDAQRPDVVQSTEGSKQRVPLRELLQSLQGNEEALGRCVMILNDLKENELPPNRIYWTEEELRKAFAGDPELKLKLERDLNSTLDGKPLDEFRPRAMWDGIVVKVKVPVRVNVGGEQKTLFGEVMLPYKTALMAKLEMQLQEKSALDEAMMKGYYIDLAQKDMEAKTHDSQVDLLSNMISDKNKKRLAENPTRVLNAATVLINESHIQEATYEKIDTNKGPIYNLKIKLNPEGVNQLWYYSHNRVGAQILLLTDGIAIAAPRISHELASSDLDITQLAEEGLVKDEVDIINSSKGK